MVGEVWRVLRPLREHVEKLLDGIDHVLLMGMGGSSLFPEVLARTFEPGPGRPRLHVLDTTHPTAIARAGELCPPNRTLHIASSKSGSTIETRSHLEWAWARTGGKGHFGVITDPGSELDVLAKQRGFPGIFENRPDIGGRYSALSLFGIVPALLAGVDADALLHGGLDALEQCGPDVPASSNPGLTLARTMANGVAVGHDKLTFRLDPEVEAFGLWLEQLVAESLGKDGTGLVPVVGERPGPPRVYGDDRTFVDLGVLPTPASIGRTVVVAEVATALAGAFIGVQPFDQPDVAAAKAATSAVLANGDARVAMTPLADLLEHLRPGHHLALQAFVDPGGPTAAALEDVRHVLRDRHRVAVTLGFGPRFLHSTGQLHKGGPDEIVCVQVLEEGTEDIPIPGRPLGFGELLAAQAAGDLRGAPGPRPHGRARRAGRAVGGGRVKVGMVGLGRMGGNMAERLRTNGHEVVGYDRSSTASDVGVARRARGGARCPPRRVGHGPRRRTHRGHRRSAGLAAAARRRRHRRGQLQLARQRTSGRGARGPGHRLGRRGHQRWRVGAHGGLLPDGRRRRRVGGRRPTLVRCPRAEDGFVHVGAAGTGHFTKMVHNGIEYGLMQAYAEGYELLARSGLDIDAVGALRAWRQGSVVRSWLLDLLVRALEARPDFESIADVAQDSGEGRWTVQEAIERGVATPVISAALYARFVSQQDESLAMKAIAALREQFGGHGVLPEVAPGEGPAVSADTDDAATP